LLAACNQPIALLRERFVARHSFSQKKLQKNLLANYWRLGLLIIKHNEISRHSFVLWSFCAAGDLGCAHLFCSTHGNFEISD